jgi:hypothetical protein
LAWPRAIVPLRKALPTQLLRDYQRTFGLFQMRIMTLGSVRSVAAQVVTGYRPRQLHPDFATQGIFRAL